MDSVAEGVATARKVGWGPFISCTDVALIDPAISATGYAVTTGRCDRTRRVRLSASFEQTWSAAGRSASTRRSDEGPATQTVTQYNSGAPAHLAGAAFPATLFDPSCTIDGRLHVRPHASFGSEDFSYRARFTLEPDAR
ncbi:hypothetical protein [Amnibacterium endophyticum]|uniref:Uncharacterized protein n=1 Tax=Amnibacterium endophyticum TaxID=2109337 RepID=A0ABW4LGA7_9MICO